MDSQLPSEDELRRLAEDIATYCTGDFIASLLASGLGPRHEQAFLQKLGEGPDNGPAYRPQSGKTDIVQLLVTLKLAEMGKTQLNQN